jgi:hypothetical protein
VVCGWLLGPVAHVPGLRQGAGVGPSRPRERWARHVRPRARLRPCLLKPAAGASPAHGPSPWLLAHLQASHSLTHTMPAPSHGSARARRRGPARPPPRPSTQSPRACRRAALQASAHATNLQPLKHQPSVGLRARACPCATSGTRSRRSAPPPRHAPMGPSVQFQDQLSPSYLRNPKTSSW